MNQRWLIEQGKVVRYLLNPHHPMGGPKCRLFIAHGFDPSRPEELTRALFAHLSDNIDKASVVVGYAGLPKLVCDGPLETPGGKCPWARSVWEKTEGEIQVRLITAYIRDPPKS